MLVKDIIDDWEIEMEKLLPLIKSLEAINL